MQDILIIAHFTQVPGETGNGRFHYIAESINKDNATVEVVTTSFSHRTKKQRNVSTEQLKDINYKLTMIYEPGYTKNVSLKRVYSHYIMGKNLKEYLKKRKEPDVIYCAVPSLNAAYVTAEYAQQNNVRFIIDVQDLWPEAFQMVFNVPIISDIVFYPMKRQADYIYASADEIIAVSQTYVNRVLKANSKCRNGHSVFLGTELDYFDNLAGKNKYKNKPEDELWLAYIGTLGHSYDIECVIDALKILKDKGIKNVKFIVMGDGPLKKKFENYAKKQGINAEFLGRLDYEKMVGILTACDIAVNPIKARSAGSIINKVGDYAAAGLPVINTQENPEYRSILNQYQAGINCMNNSATELAEAIQRMCKNDKLRQFYATNNRKLAEDKFNRKLSYQGIIDVLKK